jgi:GTPase
VHGNHLHSIPNAYGRYLQNFFTSALGLTNTPIKFEFKSGENPFKDKKNKLSERQIQKRRRMMKFTKKKK